MNLFAHKFYNSQSDYSRCEKKVFFFLQHAHIEFAIVIITNSCYGYKKVRIYNEINPYVPETSL